MVTYFCTTLGEETSKEFATGVTTVLTLPQQDPATLARHAARVLANTTRLNAKIVNLKAQQTAINAALAADPQDRAILKEKSEVEDDLAKARFNLTEDLEMALTFDKDKARKNAYCTYRDDEQRLINNWGKVYMLIIGQCTQALKDKLKEDVNWQAISWLRFY